MEYHGTFSRDINSLYKVKVNTVTEISKFQEVYDDLLNKRYNAVAAEKKRLWRKKFSLKLYKREEEMDKIFKTLISSHLFTINDTFKYEDLENNSYTAGRDNDNLHRLHNYVDEETGEKVFKAEYIFQDSIYTDVFRLREKKGAYQLRVDKLIRLPFPLETLSHNGMLARMSMKKDWNRYKIAIINGIQEVEL